MTDPSPDTGALRAAFERMRSISADDILQSALDAVLAGLDSGVAIEALEPQIEAVGTALANPAVQQWVARTLSDSAGLSDSIVRSSAQPATARIAIAEASAVVRQKNDPILTALVLIGILASAGFVAKGIVAGDQSMSMDAFFALIGFLIARRQQEQGD